MNINDLKKITKEIAEQKKVIEKARNALEIIYRDVDDLLDSFNEADDHLADAMDNFQTAIEILSEKV